VSGAPRDLFAAWAEVARRLAPPLPLLACFDYDGTLVPIRPTPEEAVAGPEVRARLSDLARQRLTTVAVVSGRTAESLRAQVPYDDLWLVGRHGITTAAPGAAEVQAVDLDAARAALEPLRRAGAALVAEHPGTRLEDKGAALALHTRSASRPDAEAAARAFHAAAASLSGFEILVGKEIHEVRPQGVDKGRAVTALRARVAPGGALLYVGDDTTDEDVFAAVDADDPRVVTVRVGDGGPTRAGFVVPDPEAVGELLRRLAGLRAGAA
jgi:trehalose 6-phosphate phosphatase